jgi:hypothetical protein
VTAAWPMAPRLVESADGALGLLKVAAERRSSSPRCGLHPLHAVDGHGTEWPSADGVCAWRASARLSCPQLVDIRVALSQAISYRRLMLARFSARASYILDPAGAGERAAG